MTTPHTVESLTKLLKQCRPHIHFLSEWADVEEADELEILLDTIDALPHQDGKDAEGVDHDPILQLWGNRCQWGMGATSLAPPVDPVLIHRISNRLAEALWKKVYP